MRGHAGLKRNKHILWEKWVFQLYLNLFRALLITHQQLRIMSIPEIQSLGFTNHTCRYSHDGWRDTKEESVAFGEALRIFREANDKRAKAVQLKDNTLREEADKDLAAAQVYHDTLKEAQEKRLDEPCSACSVRCTILRNGYG
jgi:hypothetical protein